MAPLLVPVVVSVSLLDIFERGGLVVVLEFRTQLLMDCVCKLQELREDEGTWIALKGSKSRRNRFCLVYSFNNRLLLIQLRVCFHPFIITIV